MDIESKRIKVFINKIKSWKFSFFLISKLPLAYFAGLKIKEIDFQKAIVTAPYNFLNKNPFKSIYFAVLSMAAELSTGILALMHVNKKDKKISMLVIEMQSKFYKKATTKVKFICENGNEISNAIDKAIVQEQDRRRDQATDRQGYIPIGINKYLRLKFGEDGKVKTLSNGSIRYTIEDTP